MPTRVRDRNASCTRRSNLPSYTNTYNIIVSSQTDFHTNAIKLHLIIALLVMEETFLHAPSYLSSGACGLGLRGESLFTDLGGRHKQAIM